MYRCRNYDCQGIGLRIRGEGFVCTTCHKQYTTAQLRAPFTVIQAGQFPPSRGRSFHEHDRCLNPNCDSLTWIFVDNPAPGRTHRMCAADDLFTCCSDWPEVPYTADRCFWCHHTQTRDMQRNSVLRRECGQCGREWLHPDAPAPPDPQAERKRIAFEERDATVRELDRRRHAQPEPPEYVLRQCPRTGKIEAKPTYGVKLTQQDQDDILFADRIVRAQVVKQAVDAERDRRRVYEVDDFIWVRNPRW